MSGPRQSCLLVLSSSIEGVRTDSFIQAFTLAQTAFNVQLASPQGRPVEYIDQDDTSRKWLSEFRTKSYATPAALQAIEASRYGAVLIPDSPGAAYDLCTDGHLRDILTHAYSNNKPVCTVGMGVCALACAKTSQDHWLYKGSCLTAPSVYELSLTSALSVTPLIPEDFIKDNGGRYTGSSGVHIVVDSDVVTGQNSQSTVMAVQNLILMANHRYNKPTALR